MSDQSTALQAQVLQAAGEGRRLCTLGSGSYGLAHPQSGDLLELAAHRGVVTYDPTEMVLTVRAGTPVAEVVALLAEQGQQLGVECPQLGENGTIGGAIAMGFCGSARPFTGAMRDFVLGLRMINGLGEILRFGGQVMKNVAGYDVSRALVGSQGRMGPLLELSLRVMPLAEEQLFLAFELPDLARAVAFTNRLSAAAEPLTGASYYRGLLHLRFAGRHPSLERLRLELGGEADSAAWWDELCRFQMPWGAPRWRNYRRDLAANPQVSGEWLADWNGGLVWSVEADASAAASVDLSTYSAACDPLQNLQARMIAAFDPRGMFNREEVTDAD